MMANNNTELLAEVAQYYTSKLAEFGETPQGVDWNGEDGQILRFEQLCKIIGNVHSFSINDLGCGYGALFDFLSSRYQDLSYWGNDVSDSMISTAENRFKEQPKASFTCSSAPSKVADFGIASGIFNVRMSRSDAQWQSYIESTLDVLNQTSKLGFAFNCLTSYSDSDKMRDYLYYADPCRLFDLCKRRYSRNVALLHDYGLYEFTILVRKS
jgi:SAM-dependent methyltransferase